MESLNSSGDKSKLLSFEGMMESKLEHFWFIFLKRARFWFSGNLSTRTWVSFIICLSITRLSWMPFVSEDSCALKSRSKPPVIVAERTDVAVWEIWNWAGAVLTGSKMPIPKCRVGLHASEISSSLQLDPKRLGMKWCLIASDNGENADSLWATTLWMKSHSFWTDFERATKAAWGSQLLLL